MRPLLFAALLLAHGHGNNASGVLQEPRSLFAKHLLAATREKRETAKAPDGDLEIEACGREDRVLIIHDDSEAAKDWFVALSKDEREHEGLLSLGFTVLILVNKKHGTFVFNLVTGEPAVATYKKA